MKRAYFSEGVFAAKAWGKTTFLARRAAYEASMATVSSVLIIDPPDSFRDVAHAARWPRWTSWKDFDDALGERGFVPRINIFTFGVDQADIPKYKQVFDFSVALGDCVLIVDECQLFAPKARRCLPEIVKIAAMGRHLPDQDGVERQVCLIVASQTWTGINLEVRTQIRTVVCGRMSGAANHRMLQQEVNEDAEKYMDKLKLHEFIVLDPIGAPLPPLAPMSSISG